MRISKQRVALAWLSICLLLASGASSATAADANNGRRIAQARCHIVMPNQRQDLAKSPPFEDIARQNGFNAEMLAYLILAPHPRMNLTFTREEAEDILG
jgi:hypothetical protein